MIVLMVSGVKSGHQPARETGFSGTVDVNRKAEVFLATLYRLLAQTAGKIAAAVRLLLQGGGEVTPAYCSQGATAS